MLGAATVAEAAVRRRVTEVMKLTMLTVRYIGAEMDST
jgi:hypothetical protein